MLTIIALGARGPVRTLVHPTTVATPIRLPRVTSADTSQGSEVRVEVDGAIATIRLDRPPMNALSRAVQEALRSAALELGARSDVRAVVLYGGPKVFAAGADIREMADMTSADMAFAATRLQDC